MTPTARTLVWLRASGFVAAVVEKWNPHAKIRQDFFGFADILTINPTVMSGVLAIQACVTGDQAKRIAKIALEPRAELWRTCGNRIWVVGWAKRGARGKRKLWTPSVTEVASAASVTLGSAQGIPLANGAAQAESRPGVRTGSGHPAAVRARGAAGRASALPSPAAGERPA